MMYKVPQQDNVDLKQVKLKDGTLEFRATVSISDGEAVYENPVNDTFLWPPSQDLVQAIGSLKEPFAKLCGFIDVSDMIKAADFKATKEQMKALENYLAEKMNQIRVTGIALSGTGNSFGVKITGVYKGQAINSNKVFLSKDDPELFENELKNIVDLIQDETYKYVFEGKMDELAEVDPAQMEIG